MSDKLQFVDSYPISATSDKLKFVGQRVPLTADEPATLVEMYELASRNHPKPNTLNYKRDGAWLSMSTCT